MTEQERRNLVATFYAYRVPGGEELTQSQDVVWCCGPIRVVVENKGTIKIKIVTKDFGEVCQWTLRVPGVGPWEDRHAEAVRDWFSDTGTFHAFEKRA